MKVEPLVEQPSSAVSAIARWAGLPVNDVNGLALSLGAVLIGIMTRRAMAATRNEASPKLWIELLLIPVQVIIALVAQRGAGATGIMSTIIAVSVGYGGARLVGSFLTTSGERIAPVAIPPSDAVSPRNASPAARRDLTARESPIANYGSKITPSPGLPGQDRDQDLLDRLPTTTNDEEPGQ